MNRVVEKVHRVVIDDVTLPVILYYMVCHSMRVVFNKVPGRWSMDRTLQALRVCSQKLRQYRVKKMRLVATEACRRAANGPELMRQIRKETGLKLEIIKAEEEAQLAVLSCAPLVTRDTDQLLVVDIGGGSIELVWIDLVEVEPKLRSRGIMHMHRGFRSGQRPNKYGAKAVEWV